MKILAASIGMVFVYLFYGLYLSHFDLLIIPEDIVSTSPDGFHDYSGVVNVHTLRSTGSGGYQEIIAAAQNVGLDFIYITDLNQFDSPDDVWEGYHDNLLVFVDGEYSYLNSRLLNLNVQAKRDWQSLGRAQVFFADLLNHPYPRGEDQGLIVLAHPLRPRYTWTGEYPPGLDGIEIINLKSLWQSGWVENKPSFLWSLLIFPFNDRLALLRLFRDPKGETQLWDELSSRRPTIGLAGADADARLRISDSAALRYPSYQTLFSLVRNHILTKSELTGDAHGDREKVSRALRQGSFYVSLDILANPKGFSAKLLDPEGSIFPMGSSTRWREGLEVHVHLPRKPVVPFEVEIYKDGERIVQSNAQDTRFPLPGPGVYRVKVRVIPTLPLPDGKQWIPWIFTNPFYVTKT